MVEKIKFSFMEMYPVLEVDSIDETVKFYKDKLGFSVDFLWPEAFLSPILYFRAVEVYSDYDETDPRHRGLPLSGVHHLYSQEGRLCINPSSTSKRLCLTRQTGPGSHSSV